MRAAMFSSFHRLNPKLAKASAASARARQPAAIADQGTNHGACRRDAPWNARPCAGDAQPTWGFTSTYLRGIDGAEITRRFVRSGAVISANAGLQGDR
jgi:hypothetical protein